MSLNGNRIFRALLPQIARDLCDGRYYFATCSHFVFLLWVLNTIFVIIAAIQAAGGKFYR